MFSTRHRWANKGNRHNSFHSQTPSSCRQTQGRDLHQVCVYHSYREERSISNPSHNGRQPH
eukprot:CCRYP_010696-RB/>CCRYP_010696-RB protein AED:0.48 eAED:0.48 QI:0/-1/0/1/-1/0/1/0/60